MAIYKKIKENHFYIKIYIKNISIYTYICIHICALGRSQNPSAFLVLTPPCLGALPSFASSSTTLASWSALRSRSFLSLLVASDDSVFLRYCLHKRRAIPSSLAQLCLLPPLLAQASNRSEKKKEILDYLALGIKSKTKLNLRESDRWRLVSETTWHKEEKQTRFVGGGEREREKKKELILSHWKEWY